MATSSAAAHPEFLFTKIDEGIPCLKGKDMNDQLVQYNMDKSLRILKYRFTGSLKIPETDSERLLNDFLINTICLKDCEIGGTPIIPVEVDISLVKVTITNMGFFDKLVDDGNKNLSAVNCFMVPFLIYFIPYMLQRRYCRFRWTNPWMF